MTPLVKLHYITPVDDRYGISHCHFAWVLGVVAVVSLATAREDSSSSSLRDMSSTMRVLAVSYMVWYTKHATYCIAGDRQAQKGKKKKKKTHISQISHSIRRRIYAGVDLGGRRLPWLVRLFRFRFLCRRFRRSVGR